MGGDTEFVEMGIPKVNNVKKFAYARIMRTSTFLQYVESEKVRNVFGDVLFSGLSKVDFIKCDVEGLELSVIQSFRITIEKYQPIILCDSKKCRGKKRIDKKLFLRFLIISIIWKTRN